MKAMILAAGDGTRMRPLTENLPKPMLQVAGKPLLEYHIESIARAGIHDIVINHARFGHMIEDYFGDGERFDVNICYSAEGDKPLETGGGIKRALALLGDAPFLAVNADIWTDYPFVDLVAAVVTTPYLVLVPNPEHNPKGDFALQDGLIRNQGDNLHTFSGIGLYSAEMFVDANERAFSLAPLLREQIGKKQVSGELYSGLWYDIGTPQRLQALDSKLSKEK